MRDIEFFRTVATHGVTPCWHCEPTVAPLRAPLAWFTVAQRVGKLLLNVCWRAFGSLLPDTLQSRMSIFYRTEEVLDILKEKVINTAQRTGRKKRLAHLDQNKYKLIDFNIAFCAFQNCLNKSRFIFWIAVDISTESSLTNWSRISLDNSAFADCSIIIF